MICHLSSSICSSCPEIFNVTERTIDAEATRRNHENKSIISNIAWLVALKLSNALKPSLAIKSEYIDESALTRQHPYKLKC